jgi:phosphoserine phosphatase
MRRFDLVAFDVDGTLVHGPEDLTVWEVLNRRFVGSSDQNRERYALYRAGKLSYAEWVDLDVGAWREAGASKREVIAGLAPLRLVEGTREALTSLRNAGCRLVAISGTLDVLLEHLLPDAPFDEVYCNHLGFDDRGRIDHWQATPFDMEGKARLLRTLALREGLRLERCAFVGDSGNDVWIAREAGFSIAFNPKSKTLEEIADAVVRSSDLRDLLPYLLNGRADRGAAGDRCDDESQE